MEDHPQYAGTPYGRSKVAAETTGLAASQHAEIPFVSLRLFNIFGPREAAHRLIPHIVTRIAAGATAELTSGEQIRDFVFVDDAVAALVSCAEHELAESAAFNVATGIGTSVKTIAEMVAEHLGADPAMLKFSELEPRIGEATHVIGDSSALSMRTGWSAQVPVSDGVRDTVQWAMEHTRQDG